MTERPHLVFSSDGQWPVMRMIRLCAGLVGGGGARFMSDVAMVTESEVTVGNVSPHCSPQLNYLSSSFKL